MREIGAQFPVSDLAEPPISVDEARHAPTAVCRYHGGLIANQLAEGDHYGKTYFCPIGGMLWRLTKVQVGMHRPLNFPKGL